MSIQIDSEERFSKAVKISDKINKSKMTEDELGKLYGLYKQSTLGNCNIEVCPNKITNYVGYKKWNYWIQCKGKNKNDAMNEYADLIIDIADKYGLKSSK